MPAYRCQSIRMENERREQKSCNFDIRMRIFMQQKSLQGKGKARNARAFEVPFCKCMHRYSSMM